MKLENIHIENYKSIKKSNVDLKNINILIGGNGAGKSNFISIFKLLKNIIDENLPDYSIIKGGADKLLYFGRKISNQIKIEITFYHNRYRCILEPTNNNTLKFKYEEVAFWTTSGFWFDENLHNTSENTLIQNKATSEKRKNVAYHTINALNNFKIFHFHDVSENARVKQFCNIHDNLFLFEDAGNLAAFLYWVQEKYPRNFAQIEDSLKIIAPYFHKFNLTPNRLNENVIQIEWNEKGSDILFNAHDLSDGTLRMLCLLTLFLQPKPPKIIIIDEPELGLHPKAIQLLSSIIRTVSKNHQIIIATQSVTLINQFTPEDIIIANKNDDYTEFKRLNENDLDAWIEDYSVGEMWERNLIGGRP